LFIASALSHEWWLKMLMDEMDKEVKSNSDGPWRSQFNLMYHAASVEGDFIWNCMSAAIEAGLGDVHWMLFGVMSRQALDEFKNREKAAG